MQGVGHIVARNSLSNIAGQLALKMLSFIYGVLVVRQLGDDRFGQYSTVVALVGILAVFADFGMANFAVREIAKDRSRAAALFGNMVVMRALLAIGVLGLNVLLAWVLGYNIETVGLVALASVSLLLYSLQGPLNVVLQGFERIDYTASLNVLNQVVLIIVGAVLLWQGWGVSAVIIASFCGVIANAAVAWRIARRLAELPLRIDLRDWLPLLRAGLPFGIISFATMLSFKIDTVLLSLWRPAAEVGWYNVAYNMIFALLMFSSSFNSVLVPSLSRQYKIDPASVDRFYLRAVRLLWAIGLPIAVGTALLSERLVVLIYGAEYAAAGTALRILIWVLPVLMITSLCGSITTVLHRERSTARINIVNAIFNISLNVWAIPRYGLLGAACMTVATEVLGLTQYTMLLRDAFPLRAIFLALRAPLLAALLMGGAVLLLWALPVLLIIPLAACVYGAVLLPTRGIDLDEIKMLFGTIGASLARKRAAAAE